MTLLEPIVEAVRLQTEKRKRRLPFNECRSLAEALQQGRAELSSALKQKDLAVIAEVKKASPSKGPLCSEFRPVEIAREYELGGAAAVSVLTEETFFQGSLNDLQLIADHISLPLLRKDFVVDTYQLYEAKLHKASAVLLLACLLQTDQLLEFAEICRSIGLEALVEIHDERDLDKALRASKLLGVNNRDLKTFKVDLQTSFRLASYIPRGYLKISESGFSTFDDLSALKRAGFDAFLIGETLMRAQDRAAALRRLRGEDAD